MVLGDDGKWRLAQLGALLDRLLAMGVVTGSLGKTTEHSGDGVPYAERTRRELRDLVSNRLSHTVRELEILAARMWELTDAIVREAEISARRPNTKVDQGLDGRADLIALRAFSALGGDVRIGPPPGLDPPMSHGACSAAFADELVDALGDVQVAEKVGTVTFPSSFGPTRATSIAEQRQFAV